jgi:steroid Delta-isomerase
VDSEPVCEELMQRAVEAYVSNYNGGHIERIVALFSPDAVIEDPVGTSPKIGHREIKELFSAGIEARASLKLDGPIRFAAGYAAFPLHVTLECGALVTRIDVIDIFKFNQSGRIVEMRAIFGAKNMSTAQGE